MDINNNQGDSRKKRPRIKLSSEDSGNELKAGDVVKGSIGDSPVLHVCVVLEDDSINGHQKCLPVCNFTGTNPPADEVAIDVSHYNIESQPAGRITFPGDQANLERLAGIKFSSGTFSQAHQKFISSFLEDIASRPDLAAEGRQLTKAARKEARRKAREFVTKAELEKMFSDQVKAIADSSGVIERAIINRPIFIPTSKDTTGYIKKTPTLNERIIFES